MKLQLLKKQIGNFSGALFLCAGAAFSLACDVNNQVAPPTANVNANANAAPVNGAPSNAPTAPTASAPNRESGARMPVTLPVLDAMFGEENFAGELKSKLQLTDEQIQNLKNLSREAVAGLNEADSENSGSTRAAISRADAQIRQTLGEEKAEKFFDLVRARWASGGEENGNDSAAANTDGKPNQIPTDTRVVVNAPQYRMDVFEDGKLVKTYKIGIGYPEFPLPSGTRRASTIIFNPTWTPPDEAWVKGKIEPGKKVEAGSKDNPLGPIKIPIGLPSLIHGGKAAARLGNFASHGCVGLTNQQVQDFAVVLANVSGSQLSAADVKNYEKQKTETKNFKLEKTIPVELRYETIVVEDGKLRIFRDVYERGTNTEENLRRVLEAYGVSLDELPERDKILAGLKQMAIDATGDPVDANDSDNRANSSNQNSKNSNSNANAKNANSKDGSVTRNVKGKKEVFFDIAALKGKGYPAAIEMNRPSK